MTQTPPVTAGIEGVVPATRSQDNSLVARARRGDHDAFALLIEPRALRLLRTARLIVGNETDSYEAAQEALIAAWIRLPGLRDADRFDAWLNRTLVNKCRDALRKRRRVREIDLSTTDVDLTRNPPRIEQLISVPGCIDPPKHGSTAHRASDFRNSCSTAELCRRRSRISDAQEHQLFPLAETLSTPGSRSWHDARTADDCWELGRDPGGDENCGSMSAGVPIRRRRARLLTSCPTGSDGSPGSRQGGCLARRGLSPARFRATREGIASSSMSRLPVGREPRSTTCSADRQRNDSCPGQRRKPLTSAWASVALTPSRRIVNRVISRPSSSSPTTTSSAPSLRRTARSARECARATIGSRGWLRRARSTIVLAAIGSGTATANTAA